MTGDSLNVEQAPSGPLYARVSAEDPEVGTQRGEGGLSGPQAAVQSPDPRAVLLNTITTAINQAGFWLAIEGRRAIADAVLAAHEKETAAWRHTAVRRALKISRLERTIELAEATAQSWQDDPNGHDCAHAVLDALKTYKEQP